MRFEYIANGKRLGAEGLLRGRCPEIGQQTGSARVSIPRMPEMAVNMRHRHEHGGSQSFEQPDRD